MFWFSGSKVGNVGPIAGSFFGRDSAGIKVGQVNDVIGVAHNGAISLLEAANEPSSS